MVHGTPHARLPDSGVDMNVLGKSLCRGTCPVQSSRLSVRLQSTYGATYACTDTRRYRVYEDELRYHTVCASVPLVLSHRHRSGSLTRDVDVGDPVGNRSPT